MDQDMSKGEKRICTEEGRFQVLGMTSRPFPVHAIA